MHFRFFFHLSLDFAFEPTLFALSRIALDASQSSCYCAAMGTTDCVKTKGEHHEIQYTKRRKCKQQS